jgi:hypothetical protein
VVDIQPTTPLNFLCRVYNTKDWCKTKPDLFLDLTKNNGLTHKYTLDIVLRSPFLNFIKSALERYLLRLLCIGTYVYQNQT